MVYIAPFMAGKIDLSVPEVDYWRDNGEKESI
jgi:hypothetical protein